MPWKEWDSHWKDMTFPRDVHHLSFEGKLRTARVAKFRLKSAPHSIPPLPRSGQPWPCMGVALLTQRQAYIIRPFRASDHLSNDLGR